jgi:hypothetical protein
MYAAARPELEAIIVTHNPQSVTDIASIISLEAIEQMTHVVAQRMTDDPARLTLRHDGDRNEFFARWMGVAGMGMMLAMLYALNDAAEIRARHAASPRRAAQTPSERAAARLRAARQATPHPFSDE